jgi:glycosyltransferase involved in cell wall biosynthesis
VVKRADYLGATATAEKPDPHRTSGAAQPLTNVFVVMPAYNAGATVERVFERIPVEVRRRVSRYVVVDDGSIDGTRAALARVARGLPGLVVLTHESNRGYGAAEKTLLRYALDEGADAAVLLHADGQYSPEKIPDLLRPLDSGEADVAQGSRMLHGHPLRGGMPLYKYVANRCLTALENYAFGLHMAEYHSGFLVYTRRFLEGIPFERLSDGFEFDLDMLVMASLGGYRTVEVPIPTIYADEVSHLRPVRYGLDVLAVIRRYRDGHYVRLLLSSLSGEAEGDDA